MCVFLGAGEQESKKVFLEFSLTVQNAKAAFPPFCRDRRTLQKIDFPCDSLFCRVTFGHETEFVWLSASSSLSPFPGALGFAPNPWKLYLVRSFLGHLYLGPFSLTRFLWFYGLSTYLGSSSNWCLHRGSNFLLAFFTNKCFFLVVVLLLFLGYF